MFKKKGDLVAEVVTQDKQLKAAQTRFRKRIKGLHENYMAQFEKTLRKNPGLDKTQRLKLSAAVKIANQVEGILAKAGMDDLVSDYVDAFDPLKKSALRYLEKMGESDALAGASEEALKSYIDFTENTLRSEVNSRLVVPLERGIFEAVFGDRDRKSIVDELVARGSSLSTTQIETLVSDSFTRYQRAVTVEGAASSGLEIFLYVGPMDDITSEQCEYLLNLDLHGLPGALYKDEISADLHPKLRSNPLIDGGHINCRHKYMPITLEYAKSMGFKE